MIVYNQYTERKLSTCSSGRKVDRRGVVYVHHEDYKGQL